MGSGKNQLCACSFWSKRSDLRREYLKLRRPVLKARVLVEKVLVSDFKSGGPDRCRPPPTQQHSIKGRLLTVLDVRHTETSVRYSHAGGSRSFYFVGDVANRVTSVVTGAGGGVSLLKKKKTCTGRRKDTPLPTQEPSRSHSALTQSVSLGISL